MPERNAATNHANWRRLIDGLEPFAAVASFTTNELRDALGGGIGAPFTREALNLCASRGWVDSIGDGKHRRWKVCSYDALAGLSSDDIERLDRERAAVRSEKSAKRRSQRREEQRKASAPPAWKETLQGHLQALTAREFEKLAVLIVVAEGHTNVIHTRFNSDGGKDIVADYPVSRLISQRVLVECKHTTKAQKANVGKGEYDEFYGVIIRSASAARGVLMTNGAFTVPVRELAAANPAITLQGRDEICDLLRDHELLVAARTHTGLALDGDYFGLAAAPDPANGHPPASGPGDPQALRRVLVGVLGDLDAARFLRVAADVLAAEGCDISHVPAPEQGAVQFVFASCGPLFAPSRICVGFGTAAGELTTRGIEDVRAGFGPHTGEADSGLLITRQRCDTPARDAAAGTWPIRILDIDDLSELLIKHHIGTTTSTRHTVAVPAEFADFHAELQPLYDTAHNDGTIQVEDHQAPRNGHNTN